MDFIELIFPKKCLGCSRPGIYICPSCLEKINPPKGICPMCEKPAIDGMVHFRCKKAQGLDGIISLWDYDGAVRKAILALKYRFAWDLAAELASLAVKKLRGIAYVPKEPVLVPIPLHRIRGNWRGFNQSGKLGDLIAKGMDWQCEPDVLVRYRLAKPQAGLDARRRSRNIQGVFALSPQNSSFIIPDLVLLFDDVWTTGSTLKEAAKVLKRGGAKIVWGLTIAR